MKKYFTLLLSLVLVFSLIPAASAADTTSSPTDLTVTTISDPSRISLKWSHDNLDEVDYFNVYTREDINGVPGVYKVLGTATGTEFIDPEGILANMDKVYYVTAVDVDGNESLISNYASFSAGDYTDGGGTTVGWSRAEPNTAAIWLHQDFDADYVIIHYTINGEHYDEYMDKSSQDGVWVKLISNFNQGPSELSFTYHIFGHQYDSE
ncbi:hypothetical protein [Chengkuizengella axinellae]|uniref:CBM56 domain-containing protein n=1 Tax=Chengkuizengella axinellae TaxID=3064388 RepID=A0ABT9IXP7_9BACL|nr:hypothetical protein [Chengkuizengella sp. 2205SS18-9]MDP5274092.1 hypothetical protein [Chengkuizengella sp. 2205SS18-9]